MYNNASRDTPPEARHDCTWWTLDQMRADEHMRHVNGDIITTLELLDAGLL